MNKKGCLYIPTKQHYATFLLSTKKEKVFGMFWVNPLTIPYDIATENTSFAVFILRFNSHIIHLLSVLPTNLY
jgi:hypothetical protein